MPPMKLVSPPYLNVMVCGPSRVKLVTTVATPLLSVPVPMAFVDATPLTVTVL